MFEDWEMMRLLQDVANKRSVQFNVQNCNNAPTHSQFFSTEGIPQHAVYPTWPSGGAGGHNE